MLYIVKCLLNKITEWAMYAGASIQSQLLGRHELKASLGCTASAKLVRTM